MPRWATAFNILGIFIYQTLDCIDGKQARKTGSSGPLGELFDHGCDSLVISLMAINYIAISMSGYSFNSFMALGTCLLNACVGLLSDYHTGILPTTCCWGLFGTTELHYICIFTIGAATIYPEYCNIQLANFFLPSWWCGEVACPLRVGDSIMAMLSILAFLSIASLLLTLFCDKSVNKALLWKQFFPFVLHIAFGLVWPLVIPPTQPSLALIAFALPINFASARLIVASMSHMSFQPNDFVFILYPILIITIKLDVFPGSADVLMGAYVTYTALEMMAYISETGQELCLWFNIYWYKLGSRVKVE